MVLGYVTSVLSQLYGEIREAELLCTIHSKFVPVAVSDQYEMAALGAIFTRMESGLRYLREIAK